MANTAKKAILRAKIENVLTELMVKTVGEQVYIDDSTTLSAKLAEIISALNNKATATHQHAQGDVTGLSAALNERPTTTTMNAAISKAISDLIDDAPETYDTLKEIADYIASDKTAMDALNAAIGAKVDKTTYDTLKATVDGLGSLAKKSVVSETDLDAALAEKVNAASEGNHSHLNKTVLDGITTEKVAAWDGKSKVYYSATQPAALAEGDLWFELVD